MWLILSTHPLPPNMSRRVCEGGGRELDLWALALSQTHCPLISPIDPHDTLEEELLQLEGRKRSSDVPREAFLGCLGHPGQFTMPQARLSLALQPQKTHQVRTKSGAHFSETDSREPSLRVDTNTAMAMRNAPITRTWTAHCLSMDTGSQISYEQPRSECGVRRRWPMGGIRGSAQRTLILLSTEPLSSGVTFYRKSPCPHPHPHTKTGPGTPPPCSQNSPTAAQTALHCPTSSQSHWSACLPCYILWGTEGALLLRCPLHLPYRGGSGKVYPRCKKYNSSGQDSLLTGEGLHESVSFQFFLFQATGWGHPSACSPKRIYAAVNLRPTSKIIITHQSHLPKITCSYLAWRFV